MKFKKYLLILSFLLVSLIFIGSVTASDDVDLMSLNSSDIELKSIDDSNLNEELELSQNDDSVLSEPQTIVVKEVDKNHNEMSFPTIQKAIDGAKAGDTIIIEGTSYVHCHFVVDKQLTIKSNVNTTMEVCPGSSAGSGYKGIFYISPKASGTVIEGFALTSDVSNDNDYAILVSGASDVVIQNCKVSNTGYSDIIRIENAQNAVVQNVNFSNGENAIRIKNSQKVNVKNCVVENTKNGINVIDSSQIKINDNNIFNNKVSGISFSGNGNDLTVIYNNLTENGDGLRITAPENVYILSNYIAFNKNNGVYIDNNVTYIEVKGNFFNQNIKWDVFNDFHVKNMKYNGNKIEVITNNYMINYGFGSGDMDRPVWTQMYEYRPGTSYADYIYDASKDVFTYVGEGNGDYYGHQEVMFLGYIFDINNFLACPNIYSSPGNIWSISGNYQLYLGEIKQVKKGVYSISIVDTNGNIATDLNSVPVTFYMNKASKSSTPQDGDLYKTVMMKNGTATVTFSMGDFNETGNVVTAVLPTPGNTIDSKISKTIAVNDSDIPGNPVATKIISSNANMVPNVAENYVATLKDEFGNALAGQKIVFTVNGKSYTRTTDKNGQAKVSLKFATQKTYKIQISFAESDDYLASAKTSSIIVKYSSKTAKLTVPTVTIPPKTSKSYKVTLKDVGGKGIAKQKITVKINGKTYTKTTNSKGQVAVNVKFAKLNTFKVTATYKGSKIYKKASASGKIKVAKTVTKITAPNVSVLPKQSKAYTIILKTSAGKTLSKQKITIKLNGKTYNKKTNSNGKASVSFKSAKEKVYAVSVSYKGTGIYKASKATGKITVSRIVTKIGGIDKTYAKDATKVFQITLTDKSGNVVSNQIVKMTVDGKTYSKKTNSAGKATVDVSSLKEGSYSIVTKYGGNGKYKASSKSNKITVTGKTNTSYVDKGLSNSDIQSILKNAKSGTSVVFLGDSYKGVSLTVDKSLNILSGGKTILAAKSGSPVFKISSNDVNISNFVIKGNSNNALVLEGANNVLINNNSFINALDESKIESYLDGSLMLSGYGVSISNSADVNLMKNHMSQFESAIFAQYSSNIGIINNTLKENNYGIKYGFGLANSRILENEISENIGLYIMTVPEGPSGYGIYLNNSAVNVTINKNHIAYNHLGISIDANYSTGIVITQNTITDNVLEGIRFNAGYDLAENAVEPIVTDNAIYRNARGPSMMILGELSANPEGIYGGGLLNPEERLKLDANWYGTNSLKTWDNDTGVVGYGTMCPRINTTAIYFDKIVCTTPGSYNVTFYKNGELASNLAKFNLYATLNRGTDKQVEVIFDVVGGVGSFSFNSKNYNPNNNTIEISIGSLIYSTSRVFKPTYSYDVPESEISS